MTCQVEQAKNAINSRISLLPTEKLKEVYEMASVRFEDVDASSVCGFIEVELEKRMTSIDFISYIEEQEKVSSAAYSTWWSKRNAA